MNHLDMSFDPELSSAVALKFEALRKGGRVPTQEEVREAIVSGAAEFRAKKDAEPPAAAVETIPDPSFEELNRRWLVATLRAIKGPIHFDNIPNDELADWWAMYDLPDNFAEWCAKRFPRAE